MTRALAILLIVVHLMNSIGFYALVANLERVHDQKISDQLDEDEYSGSDAITLKVPFSLPYSTFSDRYERVSGKIEYEGDHYYMIKHKFHNDTLFIVCVRNARLAEINYAYQNLATAAGDQHDGKSSNKTAAQFQVKDLETCTGIHVNANLFQLESIELPLYTFSAIAISDSPLEQPPNA